MLEKAKSRETWQDHIVNFLTGAIGEFYKARLGEKNKLSVPQDVEHWMWEVRNLLSGAQRVFNGKTKKNFNREKAYKEACEEVKEVDVKMRRQSERTIMKDYNKQTLTNSISDQDTLDFWSLANSRFID
jgi:hypothetical protein